MQKIKRWIPYILAILVGLGLAGGSYFYMTQNARAQQDNNMITILVPNKNINMYKEIGLDDLVSKQISKNVNLQDYFTKAEDLVGKVAKYEIYKESPVPKSGIVDKSSLKDMEFITININYVRANGANIGDIVDVYKVVQEKGEYMINENISLVLENAKVISIIDKYGNTPEQNPSSALPFGEKNFKLEAVKLVVQRGEARYLVPAAASQENSYVLVKKYADSEEMIKSEYIKDNLFSEQEEPAETTEGEQGDKETESRTDEEREAGAETEPNSNTE